jgi:tellurite resistance protein
MQPTTSRAPMGDGVPDPGAGYLPSLDDDKLEALVETMFVVAFADGEYGSEEREHFARSVDTLTGGRLAGSHFDHVVERTATELATMGRHGVIASIKTRLDDPTLRQVALILATDMAAADGVLHPEERAVIVGLASAFGMESDITRVVVEGPTGEPS